VPAWREWVSNVLSTLGRSGDTRQSPLNQIISLLWLLDADEEEEEKDEAC
jgi:hypothetical protein